MIDMSENPVRLLAPMRVKGEESLITHAEIRPLFAPEIAKLKQIMSGLPDDADKAFKFYHLIRNMCTLGVKSFLLDGVMPYSNSQFYVTKMQLLPSLDLAIRIALASRGRSLVISSYKCVDCGKHTFFDLDPRYPRGEAEKYRLHMLDYAKYYTPEYAEEPLGSLHHDFSEPYEIVAFDKKTTLVMQSIDFNAPNIGDYTQYSKTEGFAVGELISFFENITAINGESEAKTKEYKKAFGRDAIMRMPPGNFAEIVQKSEPYKAFAPFEYDCTHCGTTNRDRTLEPTNLFDFLTN